MLTFSDAGVRRTMPSRARLALWRPPLLAPPREQARSIAPEQKTSYPTYINHGDAVHVELTRMPVSPSNPPKHEKCIPYP
jgi:hypothetical protein